MISAFDLIGARKRSSFEPLQGPRVLPLGKQGNASLWGKWVLSDFETKAFNPREEPILLAFLKLI